MIDKLKPLILGDLEIKVPIIQLKIVVVVKRPILHGIARIIMSITGVGKYIIE